MARFSPGPTCAILALVATAAFLAFVTTSACSSVAYRPEVAQRVAEIDRARLRGHVLALDAIGPRPVSDVDATRATADYLVARLHELGYEVHEEPFEFERSSSLVAIVRPVGEPDAEPTEIEVPWELVSGGTHAMKGKSDLLAADGWKVESYRMGGGEARVFVVTNVIATRRGSRDPDQVIELSAHYDTVPFSPGADDNSSGVAALLEVARIAMDAPTRRTIRFCFFGAEEVGLRGSEAHLKVIRGDRSTRVLGLINLDGVGFTARGPDSQREPDQVPWFLSFPDEGNFIVVIGKRSSGWLGNLFEGAIRAYAPELPYYSANRIGSLFQDAGRSDHANYWSAGLPAIFLADTAEFRNQNYHRATDTPETLDYAFLESLTRATAAAALHWAKLEPASAPAVDG